MYLCPVFWLCEGVRWIRSWQIDLISVQLAYLGNFQDQTKEKFEMFVDLTLIGEHEVMKWDK